MLSWLIYTENFLVGKCFATAITVYTIQINPKDIVYKLSNFGEHNEFETTGMSEEDFKKCIENGELFYDHSADKKASAKEKVSKKVKLEKNSKNLPDFLLNNKDRYKEWFS